MEKFYWVDECGRKWERDCYIKCLIEHGRNFYFQTLSLELLQTRDFDATKIMIATTATKRNGSSIQKYLKKASQKVT